MENDPWLGKWMDLIREESADGYVLELGCGPGWDTLELLSAGCRVIAADISEEQLAECAKIASCASIIQMDLGRPFPFADHGMLVILASLSLHYFSWGVTLQISSEIKRCIHNGGILIARFNSVNDRNYGSSSTLEIEPNFYRMETGTKRFFDEESVQRFLQGWDIQYLEENVIHRYKKPKYVWEAMAVCKGNRPGEPD